MRIMLLFLVILLTSCGSHAVKVIALGVGQSEGPVTGYLVGKKLILHLPMAQYGHDGKYLLPDPTVTPGAIRLDATKDELCATGFTTRHYRHTTEKTKKEVCKEYGINKGCPGPNYEIDHLIPLEVGGLDSIQDLWPQPISQAKIKDRLEDLLRRDVCSGVVSLQDAQDILRKDWVAGYTRYFGPFPL